MADPEWMLDVLESRLKGDRRSVPITPKAASVLLCLIRRKGEIVGREAILSEVWDGVTVTPDLVREYVFDLRAALGDDPKRPRFIETIRGRGYRLVGDVGATAVDGATRSARRESRPSVGRTSSDPPQPNAAPASSPSAYRRVTALSFTIAVRSPADEAGTDAEAVYAEVARHFAEIERTVVEHGGTVAQWYETGGLVLFGAPEGQEDHARRATLAALALTTGAATAGPAGPAGATGPIRVGLCSGPLLIGVASPDRPLRVVGPSATVETAHKLRDAAPDGSILLCGVTKDTVDPDVGTRPHPIGEGEPPTFLVTRALHPRAGVPRRTDDTDRPLVGRQGEMAIRSPRLHLSGAPAPCGGDRRRGSRPAARSAR